MTTKSSHKKVRWSKGERECYEYLRSKGIEVKTEVTFEGLQNKRDLKVDFYLPDFRAAIEFDGEYHFGDPEEGDPNDRLKEDFFELKWIHLLRISFGQFNNIPQLIDSFLSLIKESEEERIVQFAGEEYKRTPMSRKAGAPDIYSVRRLRVLHESGKLPIRDLTSAHIGTRKAYQRPVDEGRVQQIKEYVLSTWKKRHFYLGQLVLAELSGDEYTVIDGQHRIAALMSLTEEDREKNLGLWEVPVSVCIYRGIKLERVVELFRAINKACPVPEVYIDEKKESLKDLAEHLLTFVCKTYSDKIRNERYPEMPFFSRQLILTQASEHLGALLETKKLSGEKKDLEEKVVKLNEELGTTFNLDSGRRAHQHLNHYLRQITDSEYYEILAGINSSKTRCYLGLLGMGSWVSKLGKGRKEWFLE